MPHIAYMFPIVFAAVSALFYNCTNVASYMLSGGRRRVQTPTLLLSEQSTICGLWYKMAVAFLYYVAFALAGLSLVHAGQSVLVPLAQTATVIAVLPYFQNLQRKSLATLCVGGLVTALTAVVPADQTQGKWLANVAYASAHVCIGAVLILYRQKFCVTGHHMQSLAIISAFLLLFTLVFLPSYTLLSNHTFHDVLMQIEQFTCRRTTSASDCVMMHAGLLVSAASACVAIGVHLKLSTAIDAPSTATAVSVGKMLGNAAFVIYLYSASSDSGDLATLLCSCIGTCGSLICLLVYLHLRSVQQTKDKWLDRLVNQHGASKYTVRADENALLL